MKFLVEPMNMFGQFGMIKGSCELFTCCNASCVSFTCTDYTDKPNHKE